MFAVRRRLSQPREPSEAGHVRAFNDRAVTRRCHHLLKSRGFCQCVPCGGPPYFRGEAAATVRSGEAFARYQRWSSQTQSAAVKLQRPGVALEERYALARKAPVTEASV